MEERLGCVLLFVIGVAIWASVVKGCGRFNSYRLESRLRAETEKMHKPGKVKDGYVPRREKRRCASCHEYGEVRWCEICGAFYCSDCYVSDIAIKHNGTVPTGE